MKKKSPWIPPSSIFLAFLAFLLPTSLFPGDLHPRITIRGFDGAPLTVDSKTPYSPKKTCGNCHDYSRITNAYHFQQGRTDGRGNMIISDTFDPRYPWNLSSGMFGKHCLVSDDSGQLARKVNESPSDIDKSVFSFLKTCGACHPGGGFGEFDRQGKLYFNEETRKIGYEDSEGSFLLDGDYTPYTSGDIRAGAPWDQSGVSEADCLMCHLKGYRWKERAKAFQSGLFKLGPTVGAGWATVLLSQEDQEGASSEKFAIDYSRKEVADFETLHLQLVRKPPDENCWACHAASEGKKRGRQWSPETDVHKAKGLDCLSCHPSDGQHNFAKGDSLQQTVRDDLDNTMNSCEDCHYKGKDRKAPRYRHPFSPRHMKRISCQACHIPSQTASADLVYDLASTGSSVSYDTSRFLSGNPVDPKPSRSEVSPPLWYPQLREFKGRIVPVKSLVVAFWGDLDERTQIVRPIPLWKIRSLKRPPLKDDDGDGVPEVNTPDEIKASLKILTSNDRFGTPVAQSPVLIKGGFLYRLTKKGDIEKIQHEQARPLDFSLSHNVLSGANVLGAGGCRDCHTKDSPFFLRKVLTDAVDEHGKPVYTEAWKRMGIDPERLDRLLLEPEGL